MAFRMRVSFLPAELRSLLNPWPKLPEHHLRLFLGKARRDRLVQFHDELLEPAIGPDLVAAFRASLRLRVLVEP